MCWSLLLTPASSETPLNRLHFICELYPHHYWLVVFASLQADSALSDLVPLLEDPTNVDVSGEFIVPSSGWGCW